MPNRILRRQDVHRIGAIQQSKLLLLPFASGCLSGISRLCGKRFWLRLRRSKSLRSFYESAEQTAEARYSAESEDPDR